MSINGNGFNNFGNNQSFVRHIQNFIGENVIIFTESGGASGCGFAGVLLSVNCDFVKIVNREGRSPDSPINPDCIFNRDRDRDRDEDEDDRDCVDDFDRDCCNGRHDRDRDRRRRRERRENLGSVCDIPICKIVAFCHNAV